MGRDAVRIGKVLKAANSQIIRWLLRLSVISVSFVAVNKLMAEALATDKGVDFTDEALYLLAASSESRTASWGFPFGWNTSLLYEISGRNISVFRSYGATLLLGASLALGWIIAHVAIEFRGNDTSEASKKRVKLLSAAILGISSLMFYGGLLRSPSYNWLAVVGVTIAASGNLMLFSRRTGSRCYCGSFSVALFSFISAIGYIIALPGRLAAPLIQFSIFLVVMTMLHGIRKTFKTTSWILLSCVALGIVLNRLSIWPKAIDTFRNALAFPPPLPKQTVSGAIGELATVPVGMANFIPGLEFTGMLTSMVFLAAITVVARSVNGYYTALGNGRCRRSITFLVTSILLLLVVTHLRISTPFYTWPTVDRTIFPGILPATTSAFVLLSCILNFRKTFREDSIPSIQRRQTFLGLTTYLRDHVRRSNIEVFFLIFYLLSLPFAIAFGSGNGLVRQSNIAPAIYVAIIVIFLLQFTSARWLVRSLSIILLVVGMSLLSFLEDSRAKPYRMLSIDSQTYDLVLADEGSVKIDLETYEYANELRSAAYGAGWTQGSPHIGLDWTWPTGTSLILGARPPQSLMLSLGDARTAEFNLALDPDGFSFQDAWISVTSPTKLAGIGGHARSTTEHILDLLNERTSLRFPEDYFCVTEIGSIQLWKPILKGPLPESSEFYRCKWQ